MAIQTYFFATRSLARAALNESTAESAKLKDFGTTAPKGERWAVLVDVPDEPQSMIDLHQSMDEAINQTHNDMVNNLTSREAMQIANRPGSIIGEQELHTPNNKPVRVSWRRNMTALRLANHLAKAS